MPIVHDETEDPPSGDITVRPRPYEGAPQVEGLGEFGSGLWTGVKKGAASMVPASMLPGGQAMKDWSHSPATGGWSETAGEWTGDIGANVAPFLAGGAALRGLGLAGEATDAIGQLALKARTAGKLGQAGYTRALNWGGNVAKWAERTAGWAAAGGTEAAIQNEDVKDPKQFWGEVGKGTVTGGVTAGEVAAGRMAYEALPVGVKHLINTGAWGMTVGGGGLMLWDHVGHGHWVPYHLLYTAAKPLYEMGKLALRTPSSVIGAASEWVREHGFPIHRSQQPGSDETVQPREPPDNSPPAQSGILQTPDESVPEQSDGSSEGQ